MASLAALALGLLALDDVGFRDAGEIGTAAYGLGVAHPTGFGLDLLLLRAASLLPLGHIAFRQNLCVALEAAVALGVLAQLCDLLARRLGIEQAPARWAGALLAAAGLLGWFTFFDTARSVEVYTLALLWVLLAALAVAHGGAALGACVLLIGLAPGLHVTAGAYALLLLVPALAPRGARGALRFGAARLPVLAAGALIIAYLPLASLRDPVPDWGDPETPLRVFAHLTAARIRDAYRAEMLSGDPSASLDVLDQLFELWPLLPLALLAVAAGLRRAPIVVLGPLALLCADLAYSIWVNPMGAVDRQVGHVAGAGLALLAGLGVAVACALAAARAAARWLALAAAFALVLALPLRLPRAELRDGYAAAELLGSGGPLAAVPPRALVLCTSDDACAAGLFALHVEAVRPDIEVLPAQHLWDPTVLQRVPGLGGPRTEPPPAQRSRAAHAVLQRLLTGAGARPLLLESADPLRSASVRARLSGGRPPPYFQLRTAGAFAESAAGALARLDRLRAARLPRGRPSAARASDAWSRAYGALGEQALVQRPELALPALHTAVQLAPTRAAAWTNLGVALEADGDLPAAIDAVRRAIALAPRRATPWVNLARLTLRQSGAQAAGSVLELARRSGVEDPRLQDLARSLPR